jgi:DNA-binding transcriptional LysR family regulator
MRSRLSLGSSEAYLGACMAGLGLAQIPRPGIEALLAAGQLVEVLPAWRPAPLPVSIIYSHNRHLSPRVRVFVDWLAEVLKLT